MNKQQLISKIKNLEGLTNEEKAKLTELLKTEKKYGLVWEDKPEAVEERLKSGLPVLQEVKERAITSPAPGAPNHTLIEGDNLEALTALNYTHAGKVDVIYIDPPYNTGNKDFVYNDSFVDREDAYRHSKWLSFMNKRLRIAKGLLSDKGVIFISIDEKEEAQLKLLCDELYGAANHLGTLTWESTTQPINTGKAKFQLQQKTEWILCYAKNKNLKDDFVLRQVYSSAKKYPFKGKLGPCRLEIIEKSDAGQYKRDTMKFPIMGHYPREGKRWQIGEDTAKWLVDNDRIEIVGNVVKKAVYPEDEKATIKLVPFWSYLSADFVGSALKGKDELKNVFGKDLGFDTVKPIGLIIELLSHFVSDTVVLDFFAGSGTTLHATMQLNNEDGGKRQCILVTNNENGICENVTYERNKRVINGYTTPEGEKIPGLGNNTLRYYKTLLLPRERTISNMRRLMRLATDMLCIRNDVYTSSPLAGRNLNNSIANYFDNGKRRMLVVYREEAIPFIVKLLQKLPPAGNKIVTYVFSPNAYAFDEDFGDVAERVELCALPSAIYNAYRHVLPTQKAIYNDIPENNETKAEE